MPGSGVTGSIIGTNSNANCIFRKTAANLSTIWPSFKIVNLVNIGILSHNTKHQVLNDLPTHGQIVDGSHLKSEEYLDKINMWSKNQKMIVKTKKNMIVNFTDRFQFHTRLQLKSQSIEVVNQVIILGRLLQTGFPDFYLHFCLFFC